MVGTVSARWEPLVVSTGTVVILLVAVTALPIAALVGVLLVLRRRKERVAAELATTYDEPLVPVELGMYRGGTGSYSGVRTTLWLVLTADVLAFHPLFGTAWTVPVGEITGIRREDSWRGHRNGRPVLVVTTSSGELGLTVREPADWEAALQRSIR